MTERKFVIMGAGEVGLFLARGLSAAGNAVTLIDIDPAKGEVVEERIDARFVLGNGSQLPTLVSAAVAECDLFIAVSASDESNLAASLLAKTMGVERTVVRVRASEDITRFGRVYERTFQADLLLSTQLLTTTLILNRVLGYNTLEIEYVASGALQVRRIVIEPGSNLARSNLSDARIPANCLVLALVADGVVRVPMGADRPAAGEDALVIGPAEALDTLERQGSQAAAKSSLVVVAGGGDTAQAVIEGLAGRVGRVRLIERDRSTAERLARTYPRIDVVHGDATDVGLLSSEGIGRATSFIALTGHDESNLMACLLAGELGVPQLTALVQRSETSTLWSKFDSLEVVSPRRAAAERIQHYIDSNYEHRIVSFENGAAQFIQRHIFATSPVDGAALRDIEVPRGLLVAGIMRDGKAKTPSGRDVLHAGDDVILFVHREELDVVQLLFPDPVDLTRAAP